jgi:predicted nucleic acid-binding protein
MTGFLIDTNVLSEYNRRGGPDAGVKQWLEGTDRQTQYVSFIILAEIQKCIEILAPGKRGTQFEEWLARDLHGVVFWARTSDRPAGSGSLGLASITNIPDRKTPRLIH